MRSHESTALRQPTNRWLLVSAVIHFFILVYTNLLIGPTQAPLPVKFAVSLNFTAPKVDFEDTASNVKKVGTFSSYRIRNISEDTTEAQQSTETVTVPATPLEPAFVVKETFPDQESRKAAFDLETKNDPDVPFVSTLFPGEDPIRNPVDGRDEATAFLEDTWTESRSQTLQPSYSQTLKLSNSQTPRIAFAGDLYSLGRILDGAHGPAFIQAEVSQLTEPAYPVLSRKRGEEGRVVMEVQINAEGGVQQSRIITSSSYETLDRAALKAMGKAVFRPATRNGMPVESERTVAYTFRLEKQ